MITSDFMEMPMPHDWEQPDSPGFGYYDAWARPAFDNPMASPHRRTMCGAWRGYNPSLPNGAFDHDHWCIECMTYYNVSNCSGDTSGQDGNCPKCFPKVAK